MPSLKHKTDNTQCQLAANWTGCVSIQDKRMELSNSRHEKRLVETNQPFQNNKRYSSAKLFNFAIYKLNVSHRCSITRTEARFKNT